jgi:hypothetical protein
MTICAFLTLGSLHNDLLGLKDAGSLPAVRNYTGKLAQSTK